MNHLIILRTQELLLVNNMHTLHVYDFLFYMYNVAVLFLFVFQVATQVAVLISKVARMGIKDWPELFPSLLQVCITYLLFSVCKFAISQLQTVYCPDLITFLL